MKTKTMTVRSTHRVRKLSREILLASAITLAAIIMFVASREPAEMVSAPADAESPAQTQQ